MKTNRRSLATIASLCCLIGAVQIDQAAAADPLGWKLAFSDDFNRSQLGDHWKPLAGSWMIANGWLSGKQGEILCALRFAGPQRIEYDARSAELSALGDHRICDLSAILAANERGYLSGYFLGFGSENNTCSKILVRGEQIARYDPVVIPFKTHRIICEWDGQTLTHMIDGKVVRQQKPQTRLSGTLHQMIGFYIWEQGYVDNIRIYTRTGKAVAPTQKKIQIPITVDQGLVANGSFEATIPGLKPPLPSRWMLQRWSRTDTVELVTDAARAHRGRRFLRVFSPKIHGLRMHAVGGGGIQMKPGTTYIIRLWARKLPGTRAFLTAEPGGKEFELTEKWQLYRMQYAHPADESSAMGMYFSVQGGPADVDDVSIVEDDKPEPTVTPELGASWQGLANVDAADTWTEPKWQSRIPITVHEVVGKNAVNYPVSLSVREVFRSFVLDFFRPQKIRVVDPSIPGGHHVPFAIVASDRNPYLSQDDQLMFLVNCPARSRKTYYIYVKDFDREEGLFTPDSQIPDAINVASEYPHQLGVDVHRSEARHSVQALIVDGHLEAEVTGWTAESALAELISPDRTRRVRVPLALDSPGRWRVTKGFNLPKDMVSGIWQLRATFAIRQGGTAQITIQSAALVIGKALWSGNATQRIYEDDPPQYGKSQVNLASAGNQWKSFQVAVASEMNLQDVRMWATELEQQDGNGQLGAENITIDCVEQALVVEGFRSGATPDPLVPWEAEQVKAGKQRVAYITIKVPGGLPAGIYTGRIVAENTDDQIGELPVRLEVFAFSLPKSRSFAPVISAGFSTSPFNRDAARADAVKKTGRFLFHRYYPMSNRRITMDMLRFLGERHMTPFYYSSRGAPYKIPWTYNVQKKTAEMVFSYADSALNLADTLDIKFLFYNSENRVRKHGGCMYAKITGTDQQIVGWHGTELGRDMFQARMQPLTEYLRKRGWAQRAVFYTNDEGFGEKTGPPLEGRDRNQIIVEYSRMIHEMHPGFKTFTADNAGGNWVSPLQVTDYFTGVMSKANQAQFREQGNVWWGLYNRMMLLTRPLAIPRITGLDYYLRGWVHHFQLEAFYAPMNPWINQQRYARAGSKSGFFVYGGNVGQGFSHYLYPWPEWRKPWDETLPTLVSSLRLEALREAIDDYEYMKMLSDTAARLPTNSPLRQRCDALVEKVKTFVANSNMGDDYRYGGSHSVMVLDGDELDQLLREIGQVIAQGLGSQSDTSP